MKKIIVSAVCSLTLLCSVTNAAQLQLKEMTPGLKNGYYIINGNYSYKSSSDSESQGSFNSEGMVVNYNGSGLVDELVKINRMLADPDFNKMQLFIRLSCKNNAISTYQFKTKDLKGPDVIMIEAPAGCAG